MELDTARFVGLAGGVMPKARYLAPWHQEDLWDKLAQLEGEGEGLSLQALRDLRGKPAIYHCVSRVVDRRFVLGTPEKEQFVRYMRLYEQFCQIRVLAFCVMSNHFHLLLEIPAPPPDRGASWSDEQLLAHLGILYAGAKHREIESKLARFRAQGHHDAARKLRESHFRRMWDLSQFMKTLKQRFTRWFNRQHERQGTLWEERFKSALVESGLAARTVAGYIDLNPVRAGMVAQPQDYRWCSLAEAVAGRKRAREGLQRVMFERELHATDPERAAEMLLDWRKTLRRYRQLLEADLVRSAPGGEAPQAPDETRPPDGAAAAAMAAATMLHRRVRHFTDGLVIGTRQFVNDVFGATRGHFGSRRTTGARKIRQVEVETPLRTMRDLQTKPG